MSETVICSVVGSEFARAVMAVEKSVARDDSRPVLSGILMEIVPPEEALGASRMTLVAADGFRLSYAHLPCTWEPWEPDASARRSVILRHKPLVNFARRVKGTIVTLEPAPGGMWCFRNDKTKEAAIIPAIDGVYPDWRKIVDRAVGEDPEPLATFNARYLAEAARTAPLDAMLTIERKASDKKNAPGIMLIRDLAYNEIATHIIMPMVVGVME